MGRPWSEVKASPTRTHVGTVPCLLRMHVLPCSCMHGCCDVFCFVPCYGFARGAEGLTRAESAGGSPAIDVSCFVVHSRGSWQVVNLTWRTVVCPSHVRTSTSFQAMRPASQPNSPASPLRPCAEIPPIILLLLINIITLVKIRTLKIIEIINKSSDN
jgi:hypothetical protein